MTSDQLAAARRNALAVAVATDRVHILRDLVDPVETRTPSAEPYRFEYDPDP